MTKYKIELTVVKYVDTDKDDFLLDFPGDYIYKDDLHSYRIVDYKVLDLEGEPVERGELERDEVERGESIERLEEMEEIPTTYATELEALEESIK